MSRRAAALHLLSLLAPGAAGAQEVTVDLQPRTLTVGDRVAATLAVRVDLAEAASEPSFPDWSRGWGEAEVLSASPVERLAEGSAVRFVQRVELTAFRTGSVALPPVTVRLGSDPVRELATPADLALEVRSVLPQGESSPAPRPVEPPRPLPVPRSVPWAIGSLAVAILAAAWAARRRALDAGESAAPAIPAFAELEAALAALAGSEPVAAHARLSAALRRYLGRALVFPAVESTSREIERALAARSLDRGLVARAVRLLRETDQVKFARRATSAEELARRTAEASAVAIAVEAHLAPPAAPSATQGAA
jgi:hypothetical protein